MNATILSSGCLELLPSFDMERVLEILEAGRITKFFSVPTVYIRLLTLGDLKKKLGKLRYCFSAGAAMAMEIVRQWKERTGITIAESYGMTEVMPITFNHYYPGEARRGIRGAPCSRRGSADQGRSGKSGRAGKGGRDLYPGTERDERLPE
jgi:acyl-coenzyme A synthetase/AMP-(fatty) acid ligase